MGALCLYLLPFRWVLGAVFAGAVHEISHLLALWLTGVPVYSVTLAAFGAKIDAGPLDTKQELFCALAGPFGSFITLLLCRIFPEAALCGLVQGFFNLLPLYPMDGGRVLRCLLPEKYCIPIEKTTIILLLALGLCGAWGLDLGAAACFPVFVLAISNRKRKIPCKETKKAVQ